MIDRKVTYPLQCLIPCWLGGEGFISGYPVTAVVLREKASVPLTLHDLFERIKRARPSGDAAPKIIAFLGDEKFFDDQLLMLVRMRLLAPCYAEYSGERPMTDRFGIMPRWDHACLRLKTTKMLISGGLLFHSVIVPTPDHSSDLISLSRQIDKAGFNVSRYASASGRSDDFDARVVRGAASTGFRMTSPLVKEALPLA